MTSATIQKVDFIEDDVGKVRKQSKKRVTWTFQVTTAQASNTTTALVEAQTAGLLDGPATQRHPPAAQKMYSVSLLWSLKTGKQHIEMNGEEVWFDRKPGASVCSHAWTTSDGLLRLEVLATGRAPKRHVAPDFRSYDLMINGRIFEELPSLEQGTTSSYDPTSAAAVSSLDAPKSIVDILYPDGYTWEDPISGTKISSGVHGSGNAVAYDEYRSHIQEVRPAALITQ